MKNAPFIFPRMEVGTDKKRKSPIDGKMMAKWDLLPSMQ
jgi:hypothetical protein